PAAARGGGREQPAIGRCAAPAPAEVGQRELNRVLDEEVQRLPEKYRVPILLCYLQGRTNEEAARQLRWPTGTVKIRLLRGREILRKRLVRRGMAMGLAGLLAARLENAAAAAVPPSLAHVTAQAGMTGGVTASVANLVEGALKRFCLTKLKVAAAVLLTVFLICFADFLMQRAEGSGRADS